jgi:hypothetical protein
MKFDATPEAVAAVKAALQAVRDGLVKLKAERE